MFWLARLSVSELGASITDSCSEFDCGEAKAPYLGMKKEMMLRPSESSGMEKTDWNAHAPKASSSSVAKSMAPESVIRWANTVL